MKITFEPRALKIQKEETDIKRYKHGYAEPESGFLYDVLQILKSQGYDVIKKRMWKDGHLMDETQQYIRTRNLKTGFMIFNGNYAIYDAGTEFNGLVPGESLWLLMEKY